MKVSRISPNIGAIITGINLKKELSEGLADEIRSLLFTHEVIFFKEQDSLTPAEYFSLVSKIFKPLKHPFVSHKDPVVPGISPFQPYLDFPEITGINHGAKNKGNLNEWHSDLNWLEQPSLGSVLRAVVVPDLGGNTLWSSMTAAYRDLDDTTKAQIANLKAYHDFTQIYRGCFVDQADSLTNMQKIYPKQAHPIALKHPITGKTSIFVNRVSTTCIDGWTVEESRELLNKLYVKAMTPEYQCRYKWEKNDIAIWDNLATQHYAVSDYWPAERKMERISLAGLKVKY